MQRPVVDKQAVEKFFIFCKENEVEFIDFRVTDVKGIWHHFAFDASVIDESSFEGIPFDGS